MEVPVALTVGVLFGSGLYLVLQRNLLRLVFGLILMSGGVNLALFVAGRLTRGISPFVAEGAYAPPMGAANPLPQALILTAIVISFGLTVFALVLLLRTYERLGTVETNELPIRLRDPHPADVSPPASSVPHATPSMESSGGTSDPEVGS